MSGPPTVGANLGATDTGAVKPGAAGQPSPPASGGFDRQALAARLRSLSADKRALFEAELGRRGIDVRSLVIPVRAATREAYPLSFAQRRLWFIQQVNPASATYNIATPRRVRGVRLDAGALFAAVQALVDRHETLRTTFRLGAEGEPEQRVHERHGPERWRQPMAVIDLAALPAAERARAAQRLAHRDALAPFDLARGPLWRVAAVRLAEDDHLLLLTMHHIVSDGWSLGILFRELLALYAAQQTAAQQTDNSAAPASAVLPELPIQYVDFALWQRQWLAGDELARQLDYWRGQLVGAPPLLALPTDRPHPPVARADGSGVPLRLAPPLVHELRALARASRTTLFVTLLAAYQLALSRLAGEDDIVIGAPIAGRNRQEVEGLIGFFINTLVLRGDLSGDPSFRELLARTHTVNEGANVHQDLPFEKLVEELAPERDLRYSPLFQASFAFQAEPGGGTALPGVEITSQPVQRGISIYELAVSLLERPQEVFGSITFKTDLFDRTTIERLRALYLRLLRAAVERPEVPLSQLSALAPAERQQIAVEWNHQPADPPPPASTLHGLFERQAALRPGATALTFEDEGGERASWSYRQLQQRATGIARRLHRRGAGPEAVVAVAMPRSPDQVAALLGTLMSGAAYLPLDPELPTERLAFMLRDARPRWLLCARSQTGDAPAAGRLPDLAALAADGVEIELLVVDREAGDGANDAAQGAPLVPEEPRLAEPPPPDPRNPAYLIYTSGSTGVPKGVVIPHGAIVRRLDWGSRHDLGDSRGERGDTSLGASSFGYLQKTALSFDVSVLEIFLPLAVGGRVVLAKPGGQWDVPYLLELIRRERLTHASFPPSMHAVLLEQPGLAEACHELEVLYTAGEAIPAAMAREIVERLGVVLDNRYGPTEATIGMLSWRCSAADSHAVVPIGRPIGDARVYITDRWTHPAPIGAAGELLIGAGSGDGSSGDGGCLARGYLRRPALTAERFVPDAVSGEAGARLYRTGDLARFRIDGAVEFLGRVDHQVKVRGFRVELGEIEAALAAHPAAREAVVIDRPAETGAGTVGTGGIELVGYWSPKPGETLPEAAEARAYLGEQLPDYMVPARLMALPELPRTASGKVDRRRLPQPEAATGGEAQLAPRDEVERQVAAIWCEVLGLPAVGVRENFFDLGGHSLLLVRVHTRLSEAFPERAPAMLDLFRFTTVAALAELLRGAPAAAGGDPAAGAADLSQALSRRQVRAGRGRAARRRAPGAGEAAEAAAGDIAIIGMAARFPGAATVEQFWQNLRNGVESIEYLSREELLAAGVSPEMADHPAYVPAVSRVKGIELFDAALFGMSPREAQMTDPQQRLLLECAWEVLERAGHDPELFQRGGERAIGVYAGVGFSRYWVGAYAVPGLLEAVGRLQVTLSNDKDFAPTRMSYKLNLTGPSVNVNTACSTSLVTAHFACQSLLAGECDMAISGGASISPWQQAGYLYSAGGIASPDGHCRAFDAQAGGSVGGNGAGVVLLKRLADALADGDTIHAVIKGSAINNDGSAKIGFTAPSIEGQTAVIAEAQSVAGVDPATIGYVETHGTGTVLGDPIEIAALRAAFRPEGGEADAAGGSALSPSVRSVAIGSVKSNIGHLSAAAGVAGLVKAALTVEHGEIPPSLHFERPNPRTELESSPFYVSTALAPWSTAGSARRRAGVSAFGLGGTNAHLVLEQAPPPAPSGPSRSHQIVMLSARTPTALEAASANLAGHLEAHPELALADVAHTLAVGRRQLACRRVVVCRSREEAIGALRPGEEGAQSTAPRALSGALSVPQPAGEGAGTAGVDSGADPGTSGGEVPRLDAAGQRTGVAFLLPGLGDHHAGMGRELYDGEEVFRRAVDRCCELLEPQLGLDLRTLLYPVQAQDARPRDGAPDLRAMLGRGSGAENATVGDDRPLDRTCYAQPAVFVIEYALARLWVSWGVEPEALIGYSLGEYTAACLAGVLPLEDCLALVAARAELIESLPAGAMLAVPLPEEELAPLLEPSAAPKTGHEVSLAAVNGAAVCVASGSEAAIAALEARLAEREVITQRVRTTHAFHSPMMRPIADLFRQRLAKATLRPPRVPYLSNVTGDWVTAAQATDPEFWVRHLCETVRFSAGMEKLEAEPGRVLLEVGPGRTLSTLALQARAGRENAGQGPLLLASMPSLWEGGGELEHLLTTLGRLWLAGVEIDREGLFAGEQRRRVALPTYPFERQRYWLNPPHLGPALVPGGAGAAAHGGRRAQRLGDVSAWFYDPAWRRSQPPAAGAGPPVGTWWLFADRRGVGERLAERLRAAGSQVELIPAPAAQREPGTGEAPEGDPYEALAQRAAGGELPAGIVHLRALDPIDCAPGAGAQERFEAAQDAGFHSLLALARALARAHVAEPLAWTVATSGVFDVDGRQPLRPELATLRGPLLVLPQEYRNLSLRHVDVELGLALDGDSEELDSAVAERAAQQLFVELGGAAAEPTVAYRGAGRWRRRFDPLPLAAVAEPLAGLRQGGVYLLIGGLGRVGLTMARFLAQRAAAKLILVGRTPLPPRERWQAIVDSAERQDSDVGEPLLARLRGLLEMEASGAKVMTLALDAGDADRLAAGLDEAGERFGERIDGVLHLAGLTQRGVVQVPAESTTPEIAARHFEAKVRVLHALETVLEGRCAGQPPDFCLLFSSIAAELGGLGFAAYAAANAYLDAFAQSRRLAGSALPWTSVDWDGWAWLPEGETPKGLAMTPAESCDAFQRLLSVAAAPRVVVSTGNLEVRLDRWVRFLDEGPANAAAQPDNGTEGAGQAGGALFARPQLTTEYEPPEGEGETKVASLWGELLGVERIGRQDNFFELGGDSLLATQLVSRLRRAFQVEMPLPAFFAAPTVAGLAAAVEHKRGQQEELSELEKALAQIKGMSADEVASQLAARSAGGDGGGGDG